MWQNFKKSHPDFEKSKSFKSDLGPQLDKIVKIQSEVQKMNKGLAGKLNECLAAARSIDATLTGYGVIVKQMKNTDKSIVADFAEITHGVDSHIKDIETIIRELEEAYIDDMMEF